jgi:hypothetical protein
MLNRLGVVGLCVAIGALVWILIQEEPTQDVDVQDRPSEFVAQPSEPIAPAEPALRVEPVTPVAGEPPESGSSALAALALIDRPDDPKGGLVGYAFDRRGVGVPAVWLGFHHPRRAPRVVKTDRDGMYRITLAADAWSATIARAEDRPRIGDGTHAGEVTVVAERTTTFNVQLAGDVTLCGNVFLDGDAWRDQLVQFSCWMRARVACSVRVRRAARTRSNAMPRTSAPPLAERPARKRPGYFAFAWLAPGSYVLSMRPEWQLPAELESSFTFQERPLDLDGDLELPTLTFTPDDFGVRLRATGDVSK